MGLLDKLLGRSRQPASEDAAHREVMQEPDSPAAHAPMPQEVMQEPDSPEAHAPMPSEVMEPEAESDGDSTGS